MKTMYAMRSYFDVVHVAPESGRLFTAQEDQPGAAPVALISDGLWRSDFGADPRIIGRSVVLDDKSTTIVGVMPPGFTSPRGTQIWVPLRLQRAKAGVTRFYFVVARMKPGMTVARVRAELATISATIKPSPMAPSFQTDPVVMTLHDRRFGDVRRPLFLLLAAVGVLMLIACLNLANLAMARSIRRQREFSLRRALGAQGARLTRYVLLESLLLSVGGAMLGLALAAVSIRTVVALSPTTVARVDGIGVDGHVVLFTILTALATALAFGLVPAIASARGDLNQVLSSGSARAIGSARQRRIRRVLVIGELATALVLLTGAGLVAKSFWRVTEIDPGFQPTNLVSAEIELPYERYQDSAASNAFFTTFMQRVHAIPSIRSAVLADAAPLGGARFGFSTGSSLGAATTPEFQVLGVASDYFRVLGIQVLEGRGLQPTDGAGAQQVVVLSRAAARAIFPNSRAVGQSFSFNGPTPATVVGVVGDVHQRDGLEGAPTPVVFAPMAQLGTRPYMTVLFRTAGSPVAAENAIAAVFTSLEPTQPPPTFTTMDKVLADEMAPRRFLFVLLGTFAALAGLLAVIGLYAVLSFLVNEQTREIGIRSALGADQSRLLRYVMRHGLVMIAAGAVLGLGGSLLAVKALSSLLYKAPPRDPATLAAAVVLLVCVAALACYVPARRASRLDPLTALRID